LKDKKRSAARRLLLCISAKPRSTTISTLLTLFAKGGEDYIRVSTSVPKPDGTGRAVGTVLAGPALDAIKAGKAFYGEVPILGTPYMTGYEPIKDSSGAQIGVYYVGYKK
jgi:hypothetical protein